MTHFSSCQRVFLAVCLGLATAHARPAYSQAANGAAATSTSSLRSVFLVPYRDPDRAARQRWLDIADRSFSAAFERDFRYEKSQVALFYPSHPDTPYFVGRIRARGLKPNFAYQLKLAGKPQHGPRGWGIAGDDRANELLGRASRWWNDTIQANVDDYDWNRNLELAPAVRDSIYGYHFLGEFVTDANGEADHSFRGAHAYHIAWQDKQSGSKDTLFGTFEVGRLRAPFYAYDRQTPIKAVKLWYEWESGREREVRLPTGTYNCRFLLTEETFHAPDTLDGGGLWPTVLASEDFDAAGKPDSNSQNDIVFTIR